MSRKIPSVSGCRPCTRSRAWKGEGRHRRRPDGGGGEYTSQAWEAYLARKGIRHQITVRDAPSQNGLAERINRTLVEKMRALLKHHEAPHAFWGEALQTAVYLYHRLPHRALKNTTPHEMWFGNRPSTKHLRIFGCLAQVLVPETRRHGKLSDRTENAVMVGYGESRKGWRLWNPATKRIIWSRDVVFHETISGFDGRVISGEHFARCGRGAAGEEDYEIDLDDSDEEDVPARAPIPPEVPDIIDIDNSSSGGVGLDASDDELFEDAVDDRSRARSVGPRTRSASAPRRSSRVRAPPSAWSSRYRDAHPEAANVAIDAAECLVAAEIPDPVGYREAVSGPEQQDWKNAIAAELDSLREHGTWDPVPVRPPAGRKLVGCRWVFRTQRDAAGNVKKRKARLVAKGFSQVAGVDFYDTFAPVMRLGTLRLALALAAERDLEVEVVDIKSAYLNGNLDEEIYMEIPEGAPIAAAAPGLGLRLRKALYGLKQAGRAWNVRLRAALEQQGFRRIQADHGAYVRGEKDGNGNSWILSWVDDLLIFARDKKTIQQIKQALAREFGLTDGGEVKSIISIRISRRRGPAGYIEIDQQDYIDSMVKKFGQEHAKTPPTPGGIIEKTSLKDRGELVDATKYRELVGALLYIAMCTRPDIAFVVGSLGRRQAEPRALDWTAALRALKYLAGTSAARLRFRAIDETNSSVVGFCDADYAECRETRRSTSGHVFLLAGAAVVWRSKRQEIVAASTTEAEYIALAEAAKEAVWIRHLLRDLGVKQDLPIDIYEDNRAALLLAKNPINHGRTKHIDVRYHLVRERIDMGDIALHPVSTEDQTADLLTKALGTVKHHKHADALGLVGLGREVRRQEAPGKA